MDHPEHSERLKLLRNHAGLQGKDLAARVGWSASKVTRIERGRQLPTYPDIAAWVTACGGVHAEVESIHALVRTAESNRRGSPTVPEWPPTLLGIAISDYTMTRFLNWAVTQGMTAEEGLTHLLGLAHADEPRD